MRLSNGLEPSGAESAFFAALYRTVTQEIEAGIRDGIFTNGEIVSRLALKFSDRYLTALERFRNHRDPSRCWRVAFDATSNDHLLIVQHLLLCMSAHINFDLGISTAQIAKTQQGLAELKPDLETIHRILAGLLNVVQGRIGAVSPQFALLDELGGRTVEALVAISIKKARETAFATSDTLIHLPDVADRIYLSGLDGLVAGFGKSITNPILRLALAPIRVAESNDVGSVLDALRRPAWLHLCRKLGQRRHERHDSYTPHNIADSRGPRTSLSATHFFRPEKLLELRLP